MYIDNYIYIYIYFWFLELSFLRDGLRCEFGDPETVAGGSMLDRVRRFDAEPNPLRHL